MAKAISPQDKQQFQKLYNAHQAGKLAEALKGYQAFIQKHPSHFDAHQLYAIALFQNNQAKAAIAAFDAALKLQPKSTLCLYNLGVIYQQMGLTNKAINSFKALVAVDDSHIEGLCQYGFCLSKIGDIEGAKTQLDKAKKAAQKGGKTSAEIYNLEANIANEQRDFKTAAAAWEKAVEAAPNLPTYYSNLANCYSELSQNKPALEFIQKAITLSGGKPSQNLIRNYSKILGDNGQYEEAYKALKQIHNALTKAGQPLGDYDYFLAIAALQKGDFETGFTYLEGRKTAFFAATEYYQQWAKQTSIAPWQRGQSLKGKDLYLCLELGYGDCLQMLRYIPQIKERFQAQNIYLCLGSHYDGLAPLLQNFPCCDGVMKRIEDQTISDPHNTRHAGLLSLPYLCQTTMDNVPPPCAPKIDKAYLDKWRQKLQDYAKKPLIGLIFQGRREHTNDHRRSIDLTAALAPFMPLIRGKKANFVLMQRENNDAADMIASQYDNFVNMGPDIHDFADSAALIDRLNLLISIDSAPAHLAASMGCPTWLLLPFNPDFRWLDGIKPNPWYPLIRLCRQSQAGDWQGLLKGITNDLNIHLSIAGETNKAIAGAK